MKVSTSDRPQGFLPFNVVLAVETEKEARALHALFNHAFIVDGLQHIGGCQVNATEARELIQDRLRAVNGPVGPSLFGEFDAFLASRFKTTAGQ